VAEAFTQQLAAGVRALKVGAGNDPATHVGPVVTKAQQSKVLNYIEIGKQEGARVVAEGRLPSDPALAQGFFVPPTLLGDVTPAMRVAQEEIFGPVVTVTVFETEEEAVEIANAPEYGLVAAIYTRDSERYLRLARQIDVGVVLINNYFRGFSACLSGEPSIVAMAASTPSRHCPTSATGSSLESPPASAPGPSGGPWGRSSREQAGILASERANQARGGIRTQASVRRSIPRGI
jgi:hypothetical protein